jgi:hypothetical protein
MVKMQYSISHHSNLTLLAANYDCAAYSAGTYNNTDCSVASSSATGGLADTGYNIIIPAALGLALLLAATILIVKRIVRRKKAH